jgi:hypothetical protein
MAKENKEEEKLESLKGKCIIKNEGYNSYYYGDVMYGSEFKKAMIFDYDKIPDYIKRNQRDEIIFLDSERGLKLVVDEIHRLENYIDIGEPRLREAKKGLEKLYNFDLVQKYVKRYNSINPLIRRDNEETKMGLVERVVNGKL